MPHFERHLDHAAQKEFYRYWNRQRGERLMPRRADIDPMGIPRLLPNVMLIDVEPGPRFRYRLLGTELVDRFGRDVSGQYADMALQGAHRQFVVALYTEVCRSKRPASAESEYISRGGVEFVCKRLVLPLSETDSEVTQLLGLQVFAHEGGLRAGPHPPKIAFGDGSIRNTRLSGA